MQFYGRRIAIKSKLVLREPEDLVGLLTFKYDLGVIEDFFQYRITRR